MLPIWSMNIPFCLVAITHQRSLQFSSNLGLKIKGRGSKPVQINRLNMGNTIPPTFQVILIHVFHTIFNNSHEK